MAVELASHVYEMSNRELNSIAQLRFLDKETQIELAQHHYLRCRNYLADNPKLCTEARDLLLGGKAKSVKMSLLQAGHLNDVPEEISNLYFSARKTGYLTKWSNWRLRMFVTQYNWHYAPRSTPPNSPPEVLEDIWERMVSNEPVEQYEIKSDVQTMMRIVAHPNTPAEIIIRASASPHEQLRQAGFARLVELEKEKKTNESR